MVIMALLWICLSFILYTYFGYPLFLKFMASARTIRFKYEDITPYVSFVIAAYNEEKSIEKKIQNTLELDYPEEKLEIIITSDGSTDRTDEIVRGYADRGVRLIRAEDRNGKTAGRNISLPEARGEIIIFSDATGIYEKNAIKELVRNFADERVGCAAGALKYVNASGSSVGTGEGLYWKYEVMLRKLESSLGNLTAVSGSIYAFRKKLYKPIPAELADDFMMPLQVKKSGYYAVYEPEAVCREETSSHNEEELSKRKRIAVRNIMGLIYMRSLLNPFRYGIFSLELFSHKILRLLVPLFLVFLYVLNIPLISRDSLYGTIFLLQNVFYLSSFIGNVLSRHNIKIRIFYIAHYFFVTNFGILMGIIDFLKGKRKAVWNPVR